MSSREELSVWSQADNMLEGGVTVSEVWSSNFLSLKLTFVSRSDLWNQLMLTKLIKSRCINQNITYYFVTGRR